MGKVVRLPGAGDAAEPSADEALEGLKGKLDGFVLTGYDGEGKQILFTTFGDLGQVTLLLHRCLRSVVDLS